MLITDHLTFSYRRKDAPVVRDLSLSLEPGRIYGLLGRNGVGKTTLLYLLSGLLTPQTGCAMLDGVNTRLRRPDTLSDILMVNDELDLPSMKLKTFVKVNAPFYPRFSAEDMARYLEVFEQNTDVRLNSLSLGQRKKVYISFALACHTTVLLLDEPTNGLDIPGKSAFRKLIASEMNDERIIVLSTHQTRDVDSMLDHLMVMDEGAMILNASVAAVTSKLKFTIAKSDVEQRNALYSFPSLEGSGIVTLNDDGSDTRMNLEALFGLAVENPSLMSDLFNTNEQ